jgi:hypothetical protein
MEDALFSTDTDTADRIKKLAIDYGLVSPYTALVAEEEPKPGN